MLRGFGGVGRCCAGWGRRGRIAAAAPGSEALPPLGAGPCAAQASGAILTVFGSWQRTEQGSKRLPNCEARTRALKEP